MRFPTVRAFIENMLYITFPFLVSLVSLYIFAVTQSFLGFIPTAIVTIFCVWLDFKRAKARLAARIEKKTWDVDKAVSEYVALINMDEKQKRKGGEKG